MKFGKIKVVLTAMMSGQKTFHMAMTKFFDQVKIMETIATNEAVVYLGYSEHFRDIDLEKDKGFPSYDLTVKEIDANTVEVKYEEVTKPPFGQPKKPVPGAH